MKKNKWQFRNYQLYLMSIPALLYFAIFHYGALYGIQIAFKDYSAAHGIWGSRWVGFEQFERFFSGYNFELILTNTLLLSVWTLVCTFPIPIILALLINQVESTRFKKVFQSVTYAPHFISLIVVVGLLFSFLSPRTGIVNIILQGLGFEPIFFMGEESWFRPLYIITEIWQRSGWNMIIYLAVLTNISPEVVEAAVMDGATKLQRIRYISIPSLMPTAIILLILATGRIMSVGFEKVFLMQTPLNLNVSQLISTYVYEVGIIKGQFSFSTAVGLFNSVVNLLLLLAVNAFAKKIGQEGVL